VLTLKYFNVIDVETLFVFLLFYDKEIFYAIYVEALFILCCLLFLCYPLTTELCMLGANVFLLSFLSWEFI
jgi:hypothetical protein